MEHVGANKRRIRVPRLLPVSVDLPVGTGSTMTVGGAPVLYGIVRRAQAIVRAKMSGVRDESRGCGGDHNAISLLERALELDANLETNVPVPVDGHVPARFPALRSDSVPDEAAAFGHDPRQFGRRRDASNDGEGSAGQLFDFHCV